MNDGFVTQGRICVFRIFLGTFLRVRIPALFRIAMLRDGACRVDRVMDDLADFPVRFMVRKEPLPMLKTLNKA
jgi:hypothetical protein